MRCHSCGAELQDNALFCRECGAKIDKQVLFCRECGAKLASDVKFCSNCGAKVDLNLSEEHGSGMPAVSTPMQSSGVSNPGQKTTNRTRVTGRTGKGGKINVPILLALFVLILAVILIIAINNKNRSTEEARMATLPNHVIQESEHAIAKGSQYAYMSDEWDVYIAEAVSDSIIRIENWDKTLSTDKKVKHSSDIGTYQINDESVEFGWLDEEHTAFRIVFSDANNSRVRRAAPHVFTINAEKSDINKGTNYSDKIACYTYYNDDWHMYRAIPLTERLIKIECWSRSMSFGSYLYGWDWCVVDVEDNSMGFEWTDEEHTSFTLTARDPQNSHYRKSDTLIVFELENPRYRYANVYDYINRK